MYNIDTWLIFLTRISSMAGKNLPFFNWIVALSFLLTSCFSLFFNFVSPYKSYGGC